jgi:hypothetical protein
LYLLFELEDRRERMLAAARRHVAQGEGTEATRSAREADWLRHGEDAWQLVALGRLLERDFVGAWEAYRVGR